MAEYRAKPGQEDRHGEMTGAISINMAITMPIVGIWCIFIGPMLLDSVWWVAGIGVALAIVLTLAGVPVSRWLWAHVSEFMDRHSGG